MKSAVLMFGFLAACRTSSIEPDPPKKEEAGITIGSKARGIELVPAPPGDVAALVRASRETARAHGRVLMVYIGAVWCEPCQRFHHAAEEGKLDDKFPTLSLLVFDLDADGDRLKRAQYAPGYIPYFGVPDENGKATRNALSGSIKGEGAIDQITPRLQELVEKAQQ